MLCRDPRRRISGAEALTHEFLAQAGRVSLGGTSTNNNEHHVSTLQRADSYERLVEFNRLRAAAAQKRWSKLRVVLKSAWSFSEPMRSQIEVERRASATARRHASRLAEEEQRLEVQLEAVRRQKEDLVLGDRWRGKPKGEHSRVGTTPLLRNQRLWLQARGER